MANGLIELDRAVDSIQVGRRHRQDLGDLDSLVRSIERLGLLVPITITPDGILVCGARRLAAVKRLGWRMINVWVRSGISTQLEQLLSEQDENTLHKQLTPSEAASLYAEMKALMAEDAARRQAATRFGMNRQQHSSDGAAKMAAPSGDTRTLAARAITGRDSYTNLERITEMQRIAGDSSQPDELRRLAADEIEAMNTDGNVSRHYHRVRAAVASTGLEHLARDGRQPAGVRAQASRELRQLTHVSDRAPADLAKVAQQALARARSATKRSTTMHLDEAPSARYRGVRAFLLLLEDVHDWADHYDPDEIGPALTDEQWAQFEAALAATVRFAERAREARSAGR